MGAAATAWIDARYRHRVGVLFWVFVIQPVASQAGRQPMLDRLISTAYPVMDVLLLAAAARLAVMSFGRRPAYSLLGIGVSDCSWPTRRPA